MNVLIGSLSAYREPHDVSPVMVIVEGRTLDRRRLPTCPQQGSRRCNDLEAIQRQRHRCPVSNQRTHS